MLGKPCRSWNPAELLSPAGQLTTACFPNPRVFVAVFAVNVSVTGCFPSAIFPGILGCAVKSTWYRTNDRKYSKRREEVFSEAYWFVYQAFIALNRAPLTRLSPPTEKKNWQAAKIEITNDYIKRRRRIYYQKFSLSFQEDFFRGISCSWLKAHQTPAKLISQHGVFPPSSCRVSLFSKTFSCFYAEL